MSPLRQPRDSLYQTGRNTSSIHRVADVDRTRETTQRSRGRETLGQGLEMEERADGERRVPKYQYNRTAYVEENRTKRISSPLFLNSTVLWEEEGRGSGEGVRHSPYKISGAVGQRIIHVNLHIIHPRVMSDINRGSSSITL